MALNKTIKPKKSNSSFCWQKYVTNLFLVLHSLAIHASIIMLGVSIDLPFGHLFQAGLKLMALIYPCPGLTTYPVTLDAPKSYPYYQFGKERLRAVIWKLSMGAEPEGLHFRVGSISICLGTLALIYLAILASHTCQSCSVSTSAPHSSLPNVELKCSLLPL